MTSATGLPQPVGSALPQPLNNAAPSLALDPADPDSAVLAWMVVLEDFWLSFASPGPIAAMQSGTSRRGHP